jgi:integrase
VRVCATVYHPGALPKHFQDLSVGTPVLKQSDTTDVYGPRPIRLALVKSLAKAPPPDSIKEIRDRHAGLILRHLPSGVLSLYVNLGRGKRKLICDARRIADPCDDWTLEKAKASARRMKVQHGDGRDFSAELRAERAVPTLKLYLDETYGPWVTENRRAGDSTLARIKAAFLDVYGNTKLSDLTPAKLETWRTRRRRDQVTGETINRDIDALRASLSRAVKLNILPKNPLAGAERVEVDRHKRVVRALTAAEKTALIAALTRRDDKMREERRTANQWRETRGYEPMPPVGRYADVLTPAVIVSLETGLRRGELFGLEWPAVDLDEKTLRVSGATAKTYETRDIPLNEAAHKALCDWWQQREKPSKDYVFTVDGGRLGSLKRSYYAILKAAGITRVNRRGERVNWHSLRHTFGSLLGAAGVDATTLMKLMGHANLETTQRYLHTDDDRKRAAVELLVESK